MLLEYFFHATFKGGVVKVEDEDLQLEGRGGRGSNQIKKMVRSMLPTAIHITRASVTSQHTSSKSMASGGIHRPRGILPLLTCLARCSCCPLLSHRNLTFVIVGKLISCYIQGGRDESGVWTPYPQ